MEFCSAYLELIRFIPLPLIIRSGDMDRARRLQCQEHNPTISLIHTDLFDNKLLTAIKDYVTRFNVLCLLHGITLPRGSRVDLDHLTVWEAQEGCVEQVSSIKPHERCGWTHS